jgi:hypothetical protein
MKNSDNKGNNHFSLGRADCREKLVFGIRLRHSVAGVGQFYFAA